MKKNISKITSIALGITTVSSIALNLHFNSLNEDLTQSHNKLNAKYKDVLVENGDLQRNNKKVSELLEHSQMEIEKLTKETDTLQQVTKQQQGAIQTLKAKVDDLTKKTNQYPLASRGKVEDGWTYYRLTYYDNRQQSTGKNPGDRGYGLTASGRPTTAGVSVAVDTSLIPLGTWILIRWADGTLEKRRADDTGSAIKGFDIDYYVPHATVDMGDPVVAVKILGKE